MPQEEEDGTEAQKASAPKPPEGKLALKAAAKQEAVPNIVDTEPAKVNASSSAPASVALGSASVAPEAAPDVVPLMSTDSGDSWRPASSIPAPPTNIPVVGVDIRLPRSSHQRGSATTLSVAASSAAGLGASSTAGRGPEVDGDGSKSGAESDGGEEGGKFFAQGIAWGEIGLRRWGRVTCLTSKYFSGLIPIMC